MFYKTIFIFIQILGLQLALSWKIKSHLNSVETGHVTHFLKIPTWIYWTLSSSAIFMKLLA